MLTLFGIVLLVAGAILTFAIERQVEGVDVQLVGWILMAGGGASLITAMVRAAGLRAASRPPDGVVVEHASHPASPTSGDAERLGEARPRDEVRRSP